MKFMIPVTKTSNVHSVNVNGENYAVGKDRVVKLPDSLSLKQIAHLADLGWLSADDGTQQAVAEATGKTPAEIAAIDEARLKAAKGEAPEIKTGDGDKARKG